MLILQMFHHMVKLAEILKRCIGGCHCLRSAKALAQQQKEELQTLRSECEDWGQLLKSDHGAEVVWLTYSYFVAWARTSLLDWLPG